MPHYVRRLLRVSSTVAIIGVLAVACTANDHTVWRVKSQPRDRAMVTSIDGKQRVIISVPAKRTVSISKDGTRTVTVEHFKKFCAEPSPDVFTVIAQSLSVGGIFGRAASPATVQASLNAAGASSEQGSTIPRTQTINMLRELMFRTCERYLSGAIDENQLPIQAVRDQRTAISILAIEQLTGAVTPKPVVIGAQGSAAAGGSGTDAAVRLDDAYKALRAATASQLSAQTAYNDMNTDAKFCEQIDKAVAEKKEDGLPQDLRDKKPRCGEVTTAKASADKAQAEAAKHHGDMLTAITKAGIPVSASTTLMTPVAGGGLDRAHDVAVEKVALAVQRIVLENFNDQSEINLFCIREMAVGDGETKTWCRDVVRSWAAKAIAENNAEAKRAGYLSDYLATIREFEVGGNSNFDKFLIKVSSGAEIDSNALQRVVNSFLASPGRQLTPREEEQISRLKDILYIPTLRDAFIALAPRDQIMLAK